MVEIIMGEDITGISQLTKPLYYWKEIFAAGWQSDLVIIKVVVL